MSTPREVPGRLWTRLQGSLSGHHPLFEVEDIRAALSTDPGGAPLPPEHANDVGEALLALARDAFPEARHRVDTLAPGARDAVIRLYFRLLERSREVSGVLH